MQRNREDQRHERDRQRLADLNEVHATGTASNAVSRAAPFSGSKPSAAGGGMAASRRASLSAASQGATSRTARLSASFPVQATARSQPAASARSARLAGSPSSAPMP